MSEEFDFDQEAFAEEIIDRLEDTLTGSMPEMISEALSECLSQYRFRLPDGTEILPPSRLRLMNPEGTKQLVCWGGLRIADTTRYRGVAPGWALEVQTRISSWEIIAVYPEKHKAADALKTVAAAMEEGKSFLQLA